MRRRVLELSLDCIRVPRTGKPGTGDTRHLLRIDLVWPRMAIARKTAERVVTLKDGVYRPDPDSWTDRIVFKESVEGPFGVRVEMSEAMNNAQWADAVARLGQAVWRLAGSSLGDVADHSLATLLWRTSADAMGRAVAASVKNAPRSIAAGTLDLHCEDWPARQIKPLALTLKAPEDVDTVTRRRVGGKTEARRRMVIRADDANGEAELIGRVYA